jgi:hypothetical protein
MSWAAIKWARKQRTGSASAKAVLICLAHHADEKGYCWPAQETMAAEIECSVDSVQRALKKLESRFIRRIKRKSSDGRRISDAYQLHLDRGPYIEPCGPAPCGLEKDGELAAENPSAEPQIDGSPGSTVRPKYLEENIQESSCRILHSTAGGARLEKRLGKGVFDAWFANVAFVEERNQVLILEADNRFVADRIEQQFDHKILECFRPEYEHSARVRVRVRKKTDLKGGTQKSG